jgi:hypothetical protein
MGSKSFIISEKKLMERSGAYLTPMKQHHIAEVTNNLCPETLEELSNLGWRHPLDVILEVYDRSEVYVCRNSKKEFIFLSGLTFSEQGEFPLFFSMFSNKIRKNKYTAFKMSKLLINLFDITELGMTIQISHKYPNMMHWAVMLGFEPMGFVSSKNPEYVEFVRCNPNKINVYNNSLRPISH